MNLLKGKVCGALVMTLVMAVTVLPVSAEAGGGNVGYASGVTKAMCSSSYWNDRSGVDSDALLMTKDQIKELNQATIAAKGSNVTDLCNGIADTYNADDIRKSLSNSEIPAKDIYIGGKKIDKEAYFSKLSSAILNTGYKGQCHTQYAVASKIGDLRAWPQDEFAGYSENDADDELQSSPLCVNEPFVIRQKCDVDGKTFYWGYTDNCTGWVNADSLAVCRSKAEWEDAWKVEVSGNDFIVVTQDKIVLDKNLIDPAVSKLTLNMGTVLKLVPEDEIPSSVSGRGNWNNYTVYVPVRDEEGNYKKTMALIAQHNSISVGYDELTGKNLLNVAFSCLGNRYGWGGMLEANDCSSYTRNVYRCFGIVMPRNTSWQKSIPGKCVSLSGMTESQKISYINKLPAGSLLYISGHTMIYTGSEAGIPYVISALGSAADSGEGEAIVQSIYSVALNPVTVRRRNGTRWAENITDAVVFENDIPDVMSCIFSDMEGYAYARDAVLYVSSKGILNGTGDESFGPGLEMSRGMILTALARMDGKDTSGGSVWYEKGIEWAMEKGISDGSSPEAPVSREQLAAILYRSSGSPEVDDSVREKLYSEEAGFSDADQISDYAADALAWAVDRGVLTGSGDGRLQPSAPAIRAQVAVMLQRYSSLSA